MTVLCDKVAILLLVGIMFVNWLLVLDKHAV